MSEEGTTQETTEATETPPETPQPTMDLDSTVKVDGEEISVRDLISARDEVKQLREYNDKARQLISPHGTTDEQREQSVRYLMDQEGYSSQDIEEYVNWTKEAGQEQVRPESYDQYPQQPTDPTQSEEARQIRYYQEQAMMQEQEKQRLSDVEQKQSRLGADIMRQQMDASLKRTFETSDDIQKLMSVNEGDDSRRNILHKEVETAMMDSLKRRRAAGETFNNAWFDEEASNAAKFVYDKFRSVIGDPDKIQRSPETATDSDSLFNQPPVESPKFEKGDDMGTLSVKSHDWTLDTLLRGAREDAAGGESKA